MGDGGCVKNLTPSRRNAAATGCTRRLNEIPLSDFPIRQGISLFSGGSLIAPTPSLPTKKAAGRFSSAAWDKNEDKTYLPLVGRTFTGSWGWGSGRSIPHLGIGRSLGIGWLWQQQELKPTAQATARRRVVNFIAERFLWLTSTIFKQKKAFLSILKLSFYCFFFIFRGGKRTFRSHRVKTGRLEGNRHRKSSF